MQSILQDTDDIFKQIVAFTLKNPVSIYAKDWYAGITCDPERRLFDEHKVDKNDARSYIAIETSNADVARKAEAKLLGSGFDGGPGGGEDDCVFVYAYLKTASTEE